MKPFNIATFFVFLLSVALCQAQSKIKLADVKRFELIRKGGGMSNYDYHLEVIRENNKWKSYQTRLTVPEKGKTQNSPRIYMKDISPAILKKLIRELAKQDTGINLKLFKINRAELVHDLDSIGINFNPEQKAILVKAIQSKNVLNRAVYQLLHPLPMDDKDYYAIIITFKTNETLTIDTRTFAYPYDLPWTVGFVQSYNPAISNI